MRFSSYAVLAFTTLAELTLADPACDQQLSQISFVAVDYALANLQRVTQKLDPQIDGLSMSDGVNAVFATGPMKQALQDIITAAGNIEAFSGVIYDLPTIDNGEVNARTQALFDTTREIAEKGIDIFGAAIRKKQYMYTKGIRDDFAVYTYSIGSATQTILGRLAYQILQGFESDLVDLRDRVQAATSELLNAF